MQGLRLGTRGSPLALAQARKVAAAIETAQRWPDGWVADRRDQDHRRQGPGPAAGRDRRQGAVDQGARPRAARRRGRFLRPFDEGRRKRPARRRSTSPRCARAATSATGSIGAESIDALQAGRGGRHLVAAARGAAAAAAARPQDRADPRQCRNPAAARSRRARSTRPCSPSAGLKRLEIDAGTAIPTEIMLPAPGQAVIGMECRTNDTRTQSVLTHGQQPDHLSTA